MATLREHQNIMLELLYEFDRVCRINDIHYILFAGSALGAVRHKGFIPWDDDLDIALLRDDYNKLMQVDYTQWNEGFFFQKEFSKHWPLHFSKLRKNNTTCLEKYHPKDSKIHQGIYIDIFPIDNAADNDFMSKLQYYASRIVIAKTKYAQGYDTDSFFKKLVMQVCRLLPLSPFHKFAMLSQKYTDRVHSFFGGSISFKKGIYPRIWFENTVEIQFESMRVPISKYYNEMLTKQYGAYMKLPSLEKRKCKVHAILVDISKNYTEYEHYRDDMTFDVYTRSIR